MITPNRKEREDYSELRVILRADVARRGAARRAEVMCDLIVLNVTGDRARYILKPDGRRPQIIKLVCRAYPIIMLESSERQNTSNRRIAGAKESHRKATYSN